MISTVLCLVGSLVLMSLLPNRAYLQLLIDIVFRIVSPVCLLVPCEILLIALNLHCLLLCHTLD